MGFAGWQAMRIAVGQRMIGAMPTVKGPPTKVRSDGRMPLVKKVAADPVASYLAKSKRGMTLREIQWMAKDFKEMGLAQDIRESTPAAVRLALRKGQQQWYLEALSEGLSLSTDQKAQASARLGTLLERDYERAFGNESGPGEKSVDVSSFSIPIYWLKGVGHDDSYAPWNLCDLTEAQISLTMAGWVTENRRAETPEGSERKEIPWISENFRTVFDSASGRRTEENGLLLLTDVFPLTTEQTPRIGGGAYFLGFVSSEGCHPSQLRMAFLMIPDLALFSDIELETLGSPAVGSSEPSPLAPKPKPPSE